MSPILLKQHGASMSMARRRVVRLTPNLFRLFRRSPVTRSCRSDASLVDQKLQIARETGRVALTTRTEFYAKTLPASL